MNPDGNVDGLLLTNNTIIRVPPHLGPLLVQSVSPQDQIKVDGFTEFAGTIHASVIMDLRTQRPVMDTPPDSAAPPPAPNLAGRQPLSASGTVKVATRAPRGEIDGAVLSDGTVVHVPPPVGQQYADLLREGQPLAVTGFGAANAYGRSVEATALGPSPDRLQAVSSEPPSPAGPAAASRPGRR